MSTGSAPLEKLKTWLLGARMQVPDPISVQLRNGLFTSVPIFLGGVLNTIAVASIAAWRHSSALFLGWLAFEIALGVLRFATLMRGRRDLAAGRKPPWLLSAVLSCLWSASVGFGAFICLMSNDWVLATITCLSTAAMVCGICLRNFGTPRLAALMVFLALAPCAVAGLLVTEAVVAIISVQLPVYIMTIFTAAFGLHRLMVSHILAVADLQRSETLNETILQFSPDYTLILDEDLRVVFCNRPYAEVSPYGELLGSEWLDLLPLEHRTAGARVLASATAGESGNLVTHYIDANNQRRWLDVIANKISDGSGRIIIVARDITHQKKSEERALWMAHHDSLTGLPNRALLQDRLDVSLEVADHQSTSALLILDVDNFKVINDTLGHDAGDALLCTFADRLCAALSDGDLVARTGGDEFALIVTAECEAEIQATAERIFAQLREPFCYEGRLLECGASIGASFIPRDGRTRSEILKAADIALYAAKAGGRAQLKIFEPAMMLEVERHQAMIAAARHALQLDTIVPNYQPKVSLATSRVLGFEALLRWRDRDGELRGPDVLRAAFEDPALGSMLSDRMLEKVLDDVSRWLRAGVQFGHVAINVAAADFRSGCFAQTLLDRLRDKGVPPSCIQIEVTETVFLGRGAGYVETALQQLSEEGIRIALDDFGTGYASLSHLNQFPVDLLKIDRSFIQHMGSNADAAAICAAVINLGHCLGLEVIAEGIETPEQEAHLIGVGCDTGQGYLYAGALAAEEVPAVLLRQTIATGSHRRASPAA
jgi:diguanylate cyclase (GGDEF)-like protein/PAS domain S-box-containing protein